MIVLYGAKDVLNYIERKTGIVIGIDTLYVWKRTIDIPIVKFNHHMRGKFATTDKIVDKWLLDIYFLIYSRKRISNQKNDKSKNIIIVLRRFYKNSKRIYEYQDILKRVSFPNENKTS